MSLALKLNIRAKGENQLESLSAERPGVPGRKQAFVTARSRRVSDVGAELVLLDSVLVKPAEALREVPAQGDGEDVDEAEQSERVEQHHGVLQEGQGCEDNARRRHQHGDRQQTHL